MVSPIVDVSSVYDFEEKRAQVYLLLYATFQEIIIENSKQLHALDF